jgi:hypothetical protein
MALTIKRKNSDKTARAELLSKLNELDIDPLVGLAYFATGNVVALGFMSADEYNRETIYAEIDGKEEIIQTGGQLKALKLITPKMRFSATRELASYKYAKRAPVAIDDDGKVKLPEVHLYLPENERDNANSKKKS